MDKSSNVENKRIEILTSMTSLEIGSEVYYGLMGALERAELFWPIVQLKLQYANHRVETTIS
jgi:hypothetical protein